jgi:8-oxo-dGTP pyrophosphatase MutT (NUDIX family)
MKKVFFFHFKKKKKFFFLKNKYYFFFLVTKNFVSTKKMIRAIMDMLCRKHGITSVVDTFVFVQRVQKAHWDYMDNIQPFKKEVLPYIRTLHTFADMLCAHNTSLSPYRSNSRQWTREYFKRLKKQETAGSILFNPDRTKVLVVRSFGAKHFSFPKGKLEQNEPAWACATRETWEETGRVVTIQSAAIPIVRKNCSLFVVDGIDDTVTTYPRTKNEIEEVQWIFIADALRQKQLSTWIRFAIKKCI